jgi:outer membrane protein OmpA-like peptidoglycan-associated protein
VRSPEVGEHLTLAVRAHLDYLRDPIVYETHNGDATTEQAALVRNQLRLWLGGSLALWQRLLVYAHVPLDVWMTGRAIGELPTATGFGMGDVGLGVRGLIMDTGLLRLGAQLSLTLPTANDPRDTPGVSGDSGATLVPRLLGELYFGKLRLGLDLGLRVRRRVELPTVRLSDQLLYGLALRVALLRELLHASAELFGSTLSADVGRRDTTALEALLGLDLRPAAGWSVGVAGGAGLLRGYGTPDFRLLLRAQWTRQLSAKGQAREQVTRPLPPPPRPAASPELVAPAAAPKPIADLDHDGHPDDADACPAFAAAETAEGCPANVLLDRQTGAIVLKPAPVFGRGNTRLDPASLTGLETLCAQLQGNHNLRVMVNAHLGPGNKRQARDLGAQRARVVGQWLNLHGVDASQLELYDCGSSRPLRAPAGSERVELFLLSPLPEQGMPSSLGCTPITLQP